MCENPTRTNVNRQQQRGLSVLPRVRLEQWRRRVHRRNLHFPRPRTMQLPYELAKALQLPDQRIVLWGDGSISHASTELFLLPATTLR